MGTLIEDLYKVLEMAISIFCTLLGTLFQQLPSSYAIIITHSLAGWSSDKLTAHINLAVLLSPTHACTDRYQ